MASKTLAPVYDLAAKQAKAAHISIAEELSKPGYKPYVEQWNSVNGRISENWQAAVRQVQAASKHQKVCWLYWSWERSMSPCESSCIVD
jgi:hypothetical protein